ncbi:MAG: hypothetical protein MJ137_05560 [Clostridia bacterium]|nr:hypothetical protein [Clostridia bacterium]
MNEKNKKRNAKKAIKAAAALMLSILMLSCLSGVLALTAGAEDEKYGNTALSVTPEAGYDGESVYSNRSFPFSVVIENKTGKDLSGYVELITSFSYNIGNTDERNTVKFPFSVADGTKKRVGVTVAGIYGDRYVLNVRDDSGKLLRTLNGSFGEYLSDSILIGWISDDPSSAKVIKRLDGYELDYSRINAVPLTPDNFPQTADILSEFSILFIDNADLSASSSYTSTQIGLIKKYLANGGTVFIGTGSRGPEILRAFREYFAENPDVSVKAEGGKAVTDNYVNSNFPYYDILNYALSSRIDNPDEELDKSDPDKDPYYDDEHEPDYNYSQKYVNTIQFKKGTVCTVNDSNFASTQQVPLSEVITYKHKTTGLYITNIDLASPELESTADSGIILLHTIIRANAYEALKPNTVSGNQAASADYLTVITEKRPSVLLMIVFLLAYIGAGIITPFCIARSKKKAIIAWVGIPAAAAPCTVVIFIYGFAVKGGGTVDNSFIIADISPSGDVNAKGLAVIKTPFSGKRTLSFDAEDVIYGGTFTNTRGSLTRAATVSYCKKDTGMNFYGTPAWEYTVLEGTWIMNGAYGSGFDISWSFDPDGKKTSVSITNNTGHDISDAVIFALGKTFTAENFKAGDKFSVDLTPSYDYFDTVEALYRLYYKPLGIHRSVAENDMNLLFYGNHYYHAVSANSSAFSLIEESRSRNRAFLIRHLASDYIGNSPDAFESIFVAGFDSAASDPVRINGGKAFRSNSETLVFQKIKISDTSVNSSYSSSGTACLSPYNSLNIGSFDLNKGSFYTIPGQNTVALMAIPVNFNLSAQVRLSIKINIDCDETPQVYLIGPDGGEYSKDCTVKRLGENHENRIYTGDIVLSQWTMTNPLIDKYNGQWKEYYAKIGNEGVFITPWIDEGAPGASSPYYIFFAIYFDRKLNNQQQIGISSVEYSISKGE